MAVLDHY